MSVDPLVLTSAHVERDARLIAAIRELCDVIGCPEEDVAQIVLSSPWRLTATVYVRDDDGRKLVTAPGSVAVRAVVIEAEEWIEGHPVLEDGAPS